MRGRRVLYARCRTRMPTQREIATTDFIAGDNSVLSGRIVVHVLWSADGVLKTWRIDTDVRFV